MISAHDDAVVRLMDSLPRTASFGGEPSQRRGIPWKTLLCIYCPGLEGHAHSERIAEVFDTPSGAFFVSAYSHMVTLGIWADDRPPGVPYETLTQYRKRTGRRVLESLAPCFRLIEHPDVHGRRIVTGCT